MVVYIILIEGSLRALNQLSQYNDEEDPYHIPIVLRVETIISWSTYQDR